MRRARFALLGLLALMTGCARGCTSSRPPLHVNPNMDLQPKYKAQSESEFFYDGATMRAPVPAALPTAVTFDRSQSGISPSTMANLGSM